MLWEVVFGQFGTRVRRHFGLDKPAVTQIQTGKLVMIKLLLQAIYLTDMIFSVSTRTFDISNNGSLFVVKNDHHRNGKRWNVFQIALGQCVFEAVAAQDFDEGMIVDIEFLSRTTSAVSAASDTGAPKRRVTNTICSMIAFMIIRVMSNDVKILCYCFKPAQFAICACAAR